MYSCVPVGYELCLKIFFFEVKDVSEAFPYHLINILKNILIEVARFSPPPPSFPHLEFNIVNSEYCEYSPILNYQTLNIHYTFIHVHTLNISLQ